MKVDGCERRKETFRGQGRTHGGDRGGREKEAVTDEGEAGAGGTEEERKKGQTRFRFRR